MKNSLSCLIALILCGAATASFAHLGRVVEHYDIEKIDARIDSILPTRVELPSVPSKLEKPTDRMNPLYGHIMEYRSRYYSANTVVGDVCRYRDGICECLSWNRRPDAKNNPLWLPSSWIRYSSLHWDVSTSSP